MKTAHDLVRGRHHATYGSQSRLLIDLADANANYFVPAAGVGGVFFFRGFDYARRDRKRPLGVVMSLRRLGIVAVVGLCLAAGGTARAQFAICVPVQNYICFYNGLSKCTTQNANTETGTQFYKHIQ